MLGLAHEHHKRSDKVARRYPAPCCPGHRRQHPVRRSVLYAKLISAVSYDYDSVYLTCSKKLKVASLVHHMEQTED